MNEKWIKLFPKMLNWEWYKDVNTKILFIHCLLKANWVERKFEGITIPRGSFITSLDSLSKELNLSTQEVKTALKHLISTNEITSISTNKYRLITITNYESYQSINNQLTSNQQSSDEQPESNKQAFYCHLKMTAKEERCIDCMKKNMCPYDVSNVFKLKHPNLTFEEYIRKAVELKKTLTIDAEKQNDNFKELEDFNWLEEEN